MYEFDEETLLDLTVNAIPLAILLFFVVLFVVLNPFGTDLVATMLQFSIVIVTFLALAVLSYYSGKAIQESEEALESAPEEVAEPQAAAADAEAGDADATPAISPVDDEADAGDDA